jgi:hypothetical protein
LPLASEHERLSKDGDKNGEENIACASEDQELRKTPFLLYILSTI